MSLAALSHVASHRECDTRQTSPEDATARATAGETDPVPRPSLRELARDNLLRLRRHKAVHSRATALRNSIILCCDLRGDDDVNRAALIAECLALPLAGQEDMQQHFEREAERWERACK
jgi:hypothetical protein